MPPPPDELRGYLSEWHREFTQRQAEHEEVRRLKLEVEKKKLEQQLVDLSAPTTTSRPKRLPIDTYAQQITAWFNRLPPEARKAPRSMEEFLNLLQGRTPGMRPHAPEVSRVLSAAGWVRRRSWVEDSGRRLWWPPLS